MDFTRIATATIAGIAIGSICSTVAGAANAPTVRVTRIEPRGIERGTLARIRVVGEHLDQLTGVSFADKRLKGKLLAPTVDGATGSCVIRVDAAAELPPGPYELRLVAKSGKLPAMTLYVDTLPQFEESGGLDDAPQVLDLPSSVWGSLARRGETDRYDFDATAGQTLVFELAAARCDAPVDGTLAVVDAEGRIVADGNDFHAQRDPVLVYRVPRDGRYSVRVSDLAKNGSDKHFYRLSVGDFALVTGTFPLSVPPHSQSEVELTGFNLPQDRRIVVQPEPPGAIQLPLDNSRFRCYADSLTVRVGDRPETLEREPNDTPDQATSLSAPGVAGGRIDPEGFDGGSATDIDLYRFSSPAGKTWILETEAASLGSPIDTKIEVLDAEGRPVPRVQLQATQLTTIQLTSINSVTAGFRISDSHRFEIDQYLYLDGEVCRVFSLPQGPGLGFRVYAGNGKRLTYFDTTATAHALDDTCYPVAVRPPNAKLLPNGLPVYRIDYVNDDEGERRRGADSKLTFTAPEEGDYLVRVTDVRGFAGDDYVYRLNLREPRPDYSVRLASREVDVAPGGTAQLRFVADRQDGFDEEIAVNVEGLPDELRLAGPVTIEKGQTEATAVLLADSEFTKAPSLDGLRMTATAAIGRHPESRKVSGSLRVGLGKPPAISIRIDATNLVVESGGLASAEVAVNRGEFDGPIAVAIRNLPHGVYVANVGLNGLLIPPGKSRQRFDLKSASWTEATERVIFAETADARAVKVPKAISRPVVLRVRDDATQLLDAGAASK